MRTPPQALSVATGPVLPLPEGGPRTLLELLAPVGATPGTGTLLRVEEDGAAHATGYDALRDRAQRTLGGLRAWGAAPGDAVLLLMDDARDVIPAVWACLAGGFAAVPIAVPDDGGPGAGRLRDAWQALHRPRVLAADADAARALLGADVRVMAADAAAAHAPDGAWHPARADDVGLVLLSSGTTGRPKLVQRTHHNLFRACQVAATSAALASRRATLLNWYPLDHNAGIMSTLAFLVAGADQVHLDTGSVLRAPERFLEAMHRHGATHTGVTGYLLGRLNEALARAAEPGWDFRRVERVTLSAEPVAARAARTFLERMAPHGLRSDVLCSAYGMSEAGSIASMAGFQPEDAAHTDGFLSVGAPYPAISIRVVDEDGRVLPEGEDGRVQVAGETVMPGYAGAPELDARAFTADGWLDTGDAGFLRDGRLTLTGRRDDLLIINGLNLHGREVEAEVEGVDGVARGHTAVCAVRVPGRDQEAVAVFLHASVTEAAERAALRRRVRAAVASRFAAPVAHVLFLRPDELPRTAVGKIRVAELRRALAEGELDAHAADDARDAAPAADGAPRTELEAALCALWAEVLGVPAVGVHDEFLGLGGHSLLAARIAGRMREVAGVVVPLRRVFEAGSVAELAAWIQSSAADGAAALPSVHPAEGDRDAPATYGQRGVWTYERMRPGTSGYNIPRALRLRGPLAVDALAAALNELVRRHQALRTVFAESGGELVQRVLPAQPAALPVADLSGADEEARAAWMRGVAQAPFDLARGPLFRAGLARLGEDDHLLALCVHHIVSDGATIGLLYRELEALYAAFAAGGASPLAEPALQFADVARWQRTPAVEAVLEEKLAWWKERLAGAPARLELPADRVRGAGEEARGGAHRFVLDPALWAGVRQAARAAGITPFMFMLAGFQALLGRYARTDDLVVGTAVSGRDRPEMEEIAGYFANALAMRADLSGDPAVGEWLARARTAVLDAFARQEVPFERVVGAVVPGGERDHRPLFQVMFTWQGAPAAPPALQGMEVSPLPVGAGAAMFDLSVTLAEEDGGVRGVFEYAAELFEPATVERLARHYRALLAGMLEDERRPLSAVPMMDADERDEVLRRWNAPGGSAPGEEGLHAPFEARAHATPGAVALEWDGGTLTYRELDACANRLARRLRAHGVGPETVVAICGERSPEMVVALLAVLKAGGAYLPLDPTHPADRLAFMLEDARPRVLLAHPAALAAFPPFAGPVLELDSGVLAADPADAGAAPEGETGGTRLAYIIYTSGSTGRPKGVMIAHRSIRNRVMWAHDHFPLDASDVVLLKTPFTFDASIWELFLPLWSGARVVVAPPAGHQDAAWLASALRERGVTVLQLVPSMLQVLLSQAEVERGTTLRLLFCGGEAFPVEVARRAAELFGARVINLYGPTEASIDVSGWEHRGDEPGALLPIGRPVNGTRLYLVDGRMEPVPAGVPGEVLASGPGLARGYLNRPGLTAEKFIPDPFSGEPGGRLYRTGDVGRRRGDGAVEFLGRTDQQVKLRGLRIEPGEIEALLSQHPGVQTAVVAVRSDGPGGEALVAYVVPAEGDAPAPAALREHLAGRLPEYMVPAAFVLLDELPRTTSGKVDRKALPAPRAAADAGGGHVPPRSPVEAALAEIWGEVLKRGPMGVHEKFFDLGGHSLTVLQLLARVRAVLGAEIPLKTLFDAPTVAGLAAAIERVRGQGAADAVPPLVPAPRGGHIPLSFAQQRLWLLHQLEPESPGYNLFDLLPLPSPVHPPTLAGALADLVARHESLRTTFPAGDGSGEQRVHPAASVPLPVMDFRGQPLESARAAAQAEAMRPFDLARGPLLRASLVRLDDGDHLLLVMHHVVSDGWSMGVIASEIAALYGARERGEHSPLAPLPVQYADVSAWERGWLRGDVLQSHLDFWRERLAGAPQVMDLPMDRARPAALTYRGAVCRVQLPAELTEALRKVGKKSSATLFMTLLASFKALLWRYGAGDDVVVGTHVAGRDRLEVERLVGFFVNALVLRTQLGGDPAFTELLKRVRATALDAFAHQRLPFERVVEELQPRRDLSITPLYQVSFDMEQGGRGSTSTARALLAGSPVARFDLEATAADTAEGLTLQLAYATDLFDASTAERMLHHWVQLLRGAAANPNRPLSSLPLLDEAETEQLRAGFQGPRRDYPLDRTLDRLFAEQAAATPHAVAAVAGNDRVTYAQLARRTEQVSALLRAEGVGRGDFVGILDRRGIDFLAGILAVHRAGAAYVPLDPAYPEARIRHMLADSGVPVLLTRTEVAAEFAAALADAPALRATLRFDALPEPADSADDADGPGTHPGDPAYMLYTSGSTGLPKGAIVRHDGAVNHIFGQLEVLRLPADFVFLQSAPASSDISVWQFLAPLATGGRTVIVDPDTVADPDALLRVIRDERVTLVELVPAVLRALLERLSALPEEDRALPELRWIMATGEEVPVDLVNAWLRAYPHLRMTNAYGPTEASDDVTQLILDAPLPEEARSVSIGAPLPNLDCHVVDAWGALVPVGVPGELCIGGVAVGTGYHRNPRRTAEAFAPDPFSSGPGAVMYRTGDRVRWTADGTLEFLGRMDGQVKVRGFRIELGEIEAALRACPGVRDCAVVVRDADGDRQLAAYLVADEAAADPSVLRAQLRDRLPGHMVPALFIPLDALPLTPAGKVNRRALSQDRRGGVEAPAEHVEPRTPTETALAEIWSAVLGRARVSVEADLFDLGAHSLLVAMAAARVRESLGVRVPLRAYFEHTTIAGLARHVDGLAPDAAASAGPVLRRVDRGARRAGGPGSLQIM